MTVDEKGRIYFSDPRYLGDEPVFEPGAAVYRLDPGGKVERIITDGGKVNRVLVSPDQKMFYVVSNDNGWTSCGCARAKPLLKVTTFYRPMTSRRAVRFRTAGS